MPLVIVGEGWNQRILLTNVDADTRAAGTIQFYTKDGAPWTVELNGKGRASTFVFDMAPGQGALFETVVSQAPQTLGWALVEASSSALGDYIGQVIFRKQTPGSPDFMTSHLLGSYGYDHLIVPFDNTDGKYTGMAILTSQICTFSCNQAQQLKVSVKAMDGTIVGTKTISQKRGVLYWMNLGADFPETNARAGTFVVEILDKYSTRLSGFSLQFAPNNAFTAITSFED